MEAKNYLELLPRDIVSELYDYIHHPNYKLADWVPLDKLDLQNFLYNKHPGVIDVLLLGKIYINPEYIVLNRLKNENPRLVELLSKWGLNDKIVYNSLPPPLRALNFDFANPPALSKYDNFPSMQKMQKMQNVDGWGDPNLLVEKCIYPDSRFIEILEKNIDNLTVESWIRLTELCKTSYLLKFLEKNLDKLDTECLKNICYSPTDDMVIRLLKPSLSKLDGECWENICRNTISEAAVELILANVSNINIECLGSLCENQDYRILDMVEGMIRDFDAECWNSLGCNKNKIVLDIISRNIRLFPLRSWENLCSNESIDSSELLKQNIDKLDDRCWGILARNKRTEILTEIIGKNIVKLQHRLCWFNVWKGLCQNTNPISVEILKSILPLVVDNILFWKTITLSHHIFTEDWEVTKIYRKKWLNELLAQK